MHISIIVELVTAFNYNIITLAHMGACVNNI